MPAKHPLKAIFILAALAALCFLSLSLLMPPEPVPASAPATEFSAERAMAHVEAMAQEPHAMGTAAHAQVRRYLLQQMQALGLEPQVQEATAINNRNGVAFAGHVYNLVGRLKGINPNDTEAILLMAHYDSQPNARGAGDDAAGVAAILETVRALRQGPPLQHDVIVLLTDGEEYGLFGAKAFLEHPWAKEVALVLNLEGRGNSGPSMTFELSPQNGWVAQQYIRHVPYPFISSLAYEIYSRMPNDTDFTVFKNAGYSGLNSAFIDGYVHYHKLTDSPANLNRGSLQQHGSNLLALVRHFGTSSLSQTKAPDTVFFNFIGSWVISYAKELNLLWFGLATLLLVAVVVLGTKRKTLRPLQSIGGLLAYLVVLVVVLGLFLLLHKAVLAQLPHTQVGAGVHGSDAFFGGFALLALGLFLLLSWILLRWLRLYELLLGVLLLCYLLVVALLVFIPLAAYLLLFPVLFGLAGMLAMYWLRLHQRAAGWVWLLLWLLASIPAIFLLFPIAQVVFTAFGLVMPLGLVALVLLLAGLLWPLLAEAELLTRFRGVPLLPLLLLVAGAGFVLLGLAQEKPTAQRPLRTHLSYYLNTDTKQAYWATAQHTPDEWNRQFLNGGTVASLKEIYPYASIQYLRNEAPAIAAPAPTATVLQDSAQGRNRHLRVRVASPRGAAHLEVLLAPQDTATLGAVRLAGQEVELRPIDTPQGPVYLLRWYGLPLQKQVDLELSLQFGKQLSLHLYDQSIGLPQQLVRNPKPPHVIAEQGRDSNLTVLRKSYSF